MSHVSRVVLFGRAARSSTRYIAGFLLLPNLCFAVLSLFVFIDRPPVNLDYLGLAVIAPWLPAIITGALFAALLLIDGGLSVGGATYHFGAQSLLEGLTVIGSLASSYVIPAALVIVAVVAAASFVVATLARKPEARVLTTLAMIFVAAFVTVLDASLSVSRLTGPRDDVAISINIATSLAMKLKAGIEAANATQSKAPAQFGIPSATDAIFSPIRENRPLPDRIVLIAVESLGSFHDRAVNTIQLQPLDGAALKRRYDVTSGVVPFQGSTVPGSCESCARCSQQPWTPIRWRYIPPTTACLRC